MRLSDIRKGVFNGLLVAALIALAAFFYHRYFYTPLDSYYLVIDARWPARLSGDSSDGRDLKGLEMMRLHLQNVTEKYIRVSKIRIYGVKSFKGITMVSEAVGSEEVTMRPTVVFEGAQLVLDHTYDIGPGGKTDVYLWGSFYLRKWIEIRSDAGIMIPGRCLFVKGIEQYFARHWILNLLIVLLTVCFIGLYFAKKKAKQL